MPEGHVIHRLANELTSTFGGQQVRVSSPQGRFPEASLIDGTTLTHAEAVGKHLFIFFEPEHIIHIHLGLIGSLRFEPVEDVWGQIRLRIDNDQVAANLRGPQWCRMIAREDYERVVDTQGADPLRDDDPARIWPRVHRSKRSIGSLLMDQKLYAGVGNIYRAETLFRLGISPFSPGNELTEAEFEAIWTDLVGLMRIGVERGRIDTVRDEHTPEAMGREPRVDDHGGEVYVYRRAGMPCYVCGTPIAHAEMEGRNLFYCPSCQKSG